MELKSGDIVKLITACVGLSALIGVSINYGIAKGATERELANSRVERARIESSVNEVKAAQKETGKKVDENASDIKSMKKDIDYIKKGVDKLNNKKGNGG